MEINDDLKRVKAPKLKVFVLRLVTGAMENRVLRPLLMPGLLEATGVKAFRASAPREAPTGHPLVEPGEPGEAESASASVTAVMTPATESEAGPGFRFASIHDFARAYRNGDASPLEVAERVIEGVDASNRSDPPLRAVIKCDAEDIRRQAAESARRLEEGEARSILEGVPVAIKDELDMPPYTTQVGTSFLGREVPPEDATPVARLRAASIPCSPSPCAWIRRRWM